MVFSHVGIQDTLTKGLQIVILLISFFFRFSYAIFPVAYESLKGYEAFSTTTELDIPHG